MENAVQLARIPDQEWQLYVVATDEPVGDYRSHRSVIIRVNPDASYEEKSRHLELKLKGLFANAYEIGEGRTVESSSDGSHCLRDYAVTPYTIDDDLFRRAIEVDDREEKELGSNWF